jgi:hypothetical protein
MCVAQGTRTARVALENRAARVLSRPSRRYDKPYEVAGRGYGIRPLAKRLSLTRMLSGANVLELTTPLLNSFGVAEDRDLSEVPCPSSHERRHTVNEGHAPINVNARKGTRECIRKIVRAVAGEIPAYLGGNFRRLETLLEDQRQGKKCLRTKR